jgi:single-strand DNA-binding protein
MASLNQCNFIGRCGKDPEVRYTAAGTAVASVSIACSEKFKGKSGEWEEKTEWVPLVFWGKLAEIVGEYVTKGKEIYVSGRMQTRKWQDKEGNDRYTTEINCGTMQMLGGKGDGAGSGGGSRGQSSGRPAADNSGYGAGQYEEPPFNPDEIPF